MLDKLFDPWLLVLAIVNGVLLEILSFAFALVILLLELIGLNSFDLALISSSPLLLFKFIYIGDQLALWARTDRWLVADIIF